MLSSVGVQPVVYTVCFLFVDKELEYYKKMLLKKNSSMLIKLNNWFFFCNNYGDDCFSLCERPCMVGFTK